MNIRHLLFPPKCLLCSEFILVDKYTSPFCPQCRAKWELLKHRSAQLGGGTPFYVFDEELYAKECGGYVLYLTDYIPGRRDNAANILILELKNRPLKALTSFAASELAAAVRRELPLVCDGGTCRDSTVITFIPRSTANICKYGFDHMGKLTEKLGEMLGLPVKRLISRKLLSGEQKKLDRKGRRKNATKTLKLAVKPDFVNGKTVLLVDDIVTSGSSLAAASVLLIEAGAAQVISLAIAKTLTVSGMDFNYIKNITEGDADTL